MQCMVQLKNVQFIIMPLILAKEASEYILAQDLAGGGVKLAMNCSDDASNLYPVRG